MKNYFVSVAMAASALSTSVTAHDGNKPRIDDHAPIGVMADHYHKKGEWMMSARWMAMNMGDANSTMMGPQDMDMSMIMVGMMYAPSDVVTLSAGFGYSEKSMEMLMNSMPMERGTKGFTDLKVNAIFPVFTSDNSRLLFKAGAILPTGETNEADAAGKLLPLKMQPGNSSWALTPSATYSYFGKSWSWGAQASATLWLDHASTGEKAGDRFALTSWASIALAQNWSISTRIAYEDESAWEGINPMSGGSRDRLRGFVGTNLYVIGTHRLGIELGFPLSENRGTNNLDTGTSLMVGWQKAF